MPYTASEIKKIKKLAQHADLKNGLLAFELIRGRGLVPSLVTEVYWIYNRLLWAKETNYQEEVADFFRTFWLATFDIETFVPILANPFAIKKSLHPDFERQAELLHLDLYLIAELFQEHFGPSQQPINSFLFKYGTESNQKALLPFLKTREHTGRFLLDLGGFKLKTLPQTILAEKNIQILKIWGNDLEELPDFWEEFKLLEVLNIAENNLKELPPSFNALNKLQKLYAQNNSFSIAPFLETIKKLPQLKYLSAASPKGHLSAYDDSANAVLLQFEELVNHGKIHAPEKEQWLILALYMGHEEALKKLTLIDLFDALSDVNEETRKRAKAQILQWKGAKFEKPLQKGDVVTILGIVSFATRNKLNENNTNGIAYTTEIEKKTTHIVLGDYPENYEAVQNRRFIFMTEEDL